MKVLIAVDGSAGSLGAVQFASRLLSEKDEVLLYYAPPGELVGGSALNRAQSHLADAIFERSIQYLPEGLRKRALHIASHREPVQGISLIAADQQCDLIVLGARGTGPLRERPLGTVSRHIVDHAALPVLLVRSPELESAEPLRVLVASDGSITSRHTGEILRQFTWPDKATGMVITVVEANDRQRLPEWLEDQLDNQQLEQMGMGRFFCDAAHEARIRADAAKWCGELPTIFAGHPPIVAVGHAAEQVLAAVAAHRIDLIVVGARRHGPVHRLLLGSTSSQVVEHAPCSVLIVCDSEQKRQSAWRRRS
ncbi:MAG TPA: universal stress protein [Lacipirellulaceae bacterium]|nr:universal stress protein [Lacipirellulaceae bacterium]HMP06106.1 universal stress protein [Lacipirellulaceae bacterium]